MSEVKRYTPSYWQCLVSEIGEYVKFEDYAKLEYENEKLRMMIDWAKSFTIDAYDLGVQIDNTLESLAAIKLWKDGGG